METPSWSRRTEAPQLLHPLWWAALGLLALNDHALKPMGLLPGWLTGKLSDVAGLVVAPVMLAAMLRTRTVAARAGAFAAVTLAFAAMKVSPAGARAAESLVALVGLHWRVVADPTDLLALAALPLAWWLCERPAPGRARVVHGLGVALSAGACVATSQPTPTEPTLPWTTSVFLTNRTSAQVDVRVRWLGGDLDCALLRAHPEYAFTRASFSGERLTVHLALDRTLPLDRDNASVVSGGGSFQPRFDDGGVARSCEAALVQVDGLPETVVFSTRAERTSVPGRLRTTEAPAGGVNLTDAGNGLLALRSSDPSVRVFALDAAGPMCTAPASQYYGWSAGVYDHTAVVERVRDLSDGCISVQFAGEPSAMSLCAPREAFPFAAGDRVTVSARDRVGGGVELHLRDDVRELTVFRDAVVGASGVLGEVGVATDDIAACPGRRLDCGGFVAPRALLVQGNAAPLLPGQSALLQRPSHTLRVFVGRVESVSLTQPECAVTAESLGTRADVALLTQEVSR